MKLSYQICFYLLTTLLCIYTEGVPSLHMKYVYIFLLYAVLDIPVLLLSQLKFNVFKVHIWLDAQRILLGCICEMFMGCVCSLWNVKAVIF